jgi:1,4-alpha-glucan branching enzyme
VLPWHKVLTKMRAPLAFLLVAACGGVPSFPSDSSDPVGDGSAGRPVDAAVPSAPRLGAQVEPGGVVFRVWAPHAAAAEVLGDFAGSPIVMTAQADGLFEGHAPGAQAGASYVFSLTTPSGPLQRVDPYCRELRDGHCVIVDPATYAWQTQSFIRPARTAAIVYEMHIGSFAVGNDGQGTFDAARDALAPLAELGVNVVELMPVQSFGGGPAGWGYNPQLFFAPKAAYGTPDALRSFVDRAHSLGIAVWLDTVVNHADAWKQAPLRCFDDACADGGAGIYFFPPGSYANTPWGPRPNYPEPQVAAMLLSSVTWWLDEMRGDGFRWDSVSNIRAIDGSGTTPGGRELLVAANDLIHASGALSVAEDLKGYGAITQSSAGSGFGFDAQWDGFGYDIDGVLTPSSDADRDLGRVSSALTNTSGGDPFARLLFVENHDTVGNGGARLPSKINAADPTSWAARKRALLAAVLLMTSPGVPMIFQGQEALAAGTFANPPTPLPAPSARGLAVRACYKDLIRLRRNLDGATGGLLDGGVEVLHRNDDAKVIAYRRHGASGQDVIVIVNLRNKAYTEYDIGVADAGPWRIRLDTAWLRYGDDFAGGQAGSVSTRVQQKDGRPFTLPLVLDAYSAMILSR